MFNLQNVKFQKVLAPISVTGGGTATCTEVDTKGFRSGAFLIQSGLVGANGVATLKWQHSETSGSGGVDITGAGHTALVGADDGINLVTFLDFRGKKRYITLVLTNGATDASLLSAVAILERAEETPDNVTERGVQEQLFA